MSADRDPAHLHPLIQPLCSRHQEIALDHGLRTQLIETHRPEADQLAAWRVGRDEHDRVIGQTITNARPGQSWHGIEFPGGRPASLAYHLAIWRPGGFVGLGRPAGPGDPMDRATELLYEALAEIGISLGLVAGARWSRRDWMHFELHPNGATLMQVMEAMRVGVDLTRHQTIITT
jgi:hypothetical protein